MPRKRAKHLCYLICSTVALTKPYKATGTIVSVSHYIGTTKNTVPERLAQHLACGQRHRAHREGQKCNIGAARLPAAFVRAGGALSVTRTWAGGRFTERQLKSYSNNAKMCPKCAGDKAMRIKPKDCTAGRRYKA